MCQRHLSKRSRSPSLAKATEAQQMRKAPPDAVTWAASSAPARNFETTKIVIFENYKLKNGNFYNIILNILIYSYMYHFGTFEKIFENFRMPKSRAFDGLWSFEISQNAKENSRLFGPILGMLFCALHFMRALEWTLHALCWHPICFFVSNSVTLHLCLLTAFCIGLLALVVLGHFIALRLGTFTPEIFKPPGVAQELLVSWCYCNTSVFKFHFPYLLCEQRVMSKWVAWCMFIAVAFDNLICSMRLLPNSSRRLSSNDWDDFWTLSVTLLNCLPEKNSQVCISFVPNLCIAASPKVDAARLWTGVVRGQRPAPRIKHGENPGNFCTKLQLTTSLPPHGNRGKIFSAFSAESYPSLSPLYFGHLDIINDLYCNSLLPEFTDHAQELPPPECPYQLKSSTLRLMLCQNDHTVAILDSVADVAVARRHNECNESTELNSGWGFEVESWCKSDPLLQKLKST